MHSRQLFPEIMDDPGLDPEQHRAALRGLARINAVSNAASPLVRAIASRPWPDGRVRLVDVAVGSGDVPLRVMAGLRARGLSPTLTGLDISPRATSECRARFARAGFGKDSAEFISGNALTDPLPNADVLTCSLFIHHLQDGEIPVLLRSMANAATGMVLVSDLARSRRGLAASMIVPRLLTRSPVVHTDAVLSYRGALTPAELAAHAETASMHGARIRRAFPFRMLLRWDAPAP